MAIVSSLKRFRHEFNLSQQDVAATLGMKQQSYSAYEAAKNPVTPSVTFIINLAKAYGVSADYLLGLTDEPNQALAPVPAPEDEFTRAAIVFADAMRNAVNQRLQEKTEV